MEWWGNLGVLSSNDPFFSSVQLLLHGEGANNSTTITDSSGTPKSLTAYGSACISTAQFYAGSSSLKLTGGSDGILSGASIPSCQIPTNGSATIEAFIRPSVVNANQVIVCNYYYISGGVEQGWLFRVLSNGQLQFYNAALGTNVAGGSIVANAWQYVACRISAGSLTLHVNGTQVAGPASIGAFSYNNARLGIGCAYYSGQTNNIFNSMNGSIDECRLTIGVARDVSTTPSVPFPDT